MMFHDSDTDSGWTDIPFIEGNSNMQPRLSAQSASLVKKSNLGELQRSKMNLRRVEFTVNARRNSFDKL